MGSSEQLIYLLHQAKIDELKLLAKILDVDAVNSSQIVVSLREAGGHSIANFFGDEGVPYHEIVNDVAQEVECGGYGSLSLAERNVVDLEEKIVKKVFENMLSKMEPGERRKFEEDLLKEAKKYSDSYTGLAATGGGLVVAGMAGFAPYLMATSLTSAFAGAFGVTMSFGFYTSLTSFMSVALGPVGWAFLAGAAIFKVGSTNYKKTIPCVVIISSIRQRIKIDNEQMSIYGITYDINQKRYKYKQYKYEKLSDAIDYAKKY